MKVLGIHSLGHDTGVSCFEDGRLLFSIETERLTREKHDHRSEIALRYLFDQGVARPEEIGLVAASTGIRNRVLNVPDLDAAVASLGPGRLCHETTCEIGGRAIPCAVVLHEAAHAALALHYAGYAVPCLVLVNEGRGQISRNSLYLYDGRTLDLLESDQLPWYGTGWGWSALGWLFGMGIHPSIAGKVMAMGAFGGYSESVAALFRGIDDRVLADLERRDEAGQKLLQEPIFQDGFASHATAVHTLQRMFTEAVCAYLERKAREHGARAVALGGGCALNINTNSALRQVLGVPVAIPPACSDSGHCLGAALYANRFLLGIESPPFPCYFNGLAETPAAVAEVAREAGLELRPSDPATIAARLADGAIVALFNGVSEIGPRALGNRSLLANPRIPGMKKRLSEGVKQREWYRPLGSVMRLERFQEVFPGEPPSPYMLYSYASPDGLMPEATHADGTSRVQTVTAEENPFLHHLLGELEGQSGIAALINTSLNSRNRAIAYRARDVIEDFATADVDLFVFGEVMAEARR